MKPLSSIFVGCGRSTTWRDSGRSMTTSATAGSCCVKTSSSMPRLSMRQCRSQDLALDAEVEHLTDHGQQTIGLHRRGLDLVIQ